MTITNEPTTTPEVPAWLNLDGYCPSSVRQDLERATEALEAVLADGTISEACWKAYFALRRHATATGGPDTDGLTEHDPLLDLLNELTGYERLQRAGRALASLALCAIGEGPLNPEDTPSWFAGYGSLGGEQVEWIEREKRGEEVQS